MRLFAIATTDSKGQTTDKAIRDAVPTWMNNNCQLVNSERGKHLVFLHQLIKFEDSATTKTFSVLQQSSRPKYSSTLASLLQMLVCVASMPDNDMPIKLDPAVLSAAKTFAANIGPDQMQELMIVLLKDASDFGGMNIRIYLNTWNVVILYM